MSRGTYDQRAPSASSQIICLERLLEEAEARNEQLREALRSIAKEEDTLGWIYAARIAKTALKENNDE